MTQTEAASITSESTLERMLDELPDMVVVLDGTANLMWANRRAEAFFGLALDETVGMSALDLVHPDDLEFVLRSLETVQGKETGNQIEIRVRVGSEWRLIELIGCPVGWYADGAIIFSMRDLTTRRRFEVARNDDARFRSLYHNSTSIVLLVTPDGLIESASGALTRVLGHDPEVLEHRPLADIVATSDRPALTAALGRALRGATASQPAVVGVNLLHREGAETTAFELSIVNLVDDPTVNGLVVAAHDVSTRVEAEKELRKALRDLRAAHSLLNATLDSTAGGILVVGKDRSITSFNRQFADMWRIPEELLAKKDDVRTLEFVLDQLIDPAAFIARVDELYSHPASESSDTLQFKDGRVFERLSRPQYLAGRVAGRVWSFIDVTDQKRLEADLVHMAFHDHLTGLANRALFKDRLEQALARSARTRVPAAVLFLDIDDFKTINDSMGHSAGDALLKSVASRVGMCLRPTDTAARLGGDEFAIIIEDIEEASSVLGLAERIITMVREPFEIGARSLFVTASMGVSFSAKGTTGEELLRDADLAMYTAKLQGKDRVVEYQPQMRISPLG